MSGNWWERASLSNAHIICNWDFILICIPFSFYIQYKFKNSYCIYFTNLIHSIPIQYIKYIIISSLALLWLKKLHSIAIDPFFTAKIQHNSITYPTRSCEPLQAMDSLLLSLSWFSSFSFFFFAMGWNHRIGLNNCLCIIYSRKLLISDKGVHPESLDSWYSKIISKYGSPKVRNGLAC